MFAFWCIWPQPTCPFAAQFVFNVVRFVSEEFDDFILVLFHYCFTLNKKGKIHTYTTSFFLCSSLGCAGGLSGKNYTHRKLHAGCNPWIQRGLRQVHGLAAPRLDPDVRFPVCGGIRALAVVPHPLAYALHELQEVSFWACQRNLVVSEFRSSFYCQPTETNWYL